MTAGATVASTKRSILVDQHLRIVPAEGKHLWPVLMRPNATVLDASECIISTKGQIRGRQQRGCGDPDAAILLFHAVLAAAVMTEILADG